jgi:deazaflavin-dependent oxidoreductase (nitroreductase family)
MPFNFLMVWLLRSPLHRLISGSTMLVQYTGRKSGKAYAVPVNYLSADGALITLSLHSRTWWRSLRQSPVTLRLRGQDVPARAEVFETPEDVAQALLAVVRGNPKYARFLKIDLDEAGKPVPEDALKAAGERVAVRFYIQ